MRIRLSASQIVDADDCRRLYWFKHIAKVKVVGLVANLAFGRCIDVSVREYLRALTLGTALPDPVDRFLELWNTARRESELVYAATQSPADFEHMGQELMTQWPLAWEQTGFQVVTDQAGHPLLDVNLKLPLGHASGIELWLSGRLDLVVYTAEAQLGVVDIKTAARVHTPLFTHRSDQLTTYQLLLEGHRRRLGLACVEWLGFFDLVKRKRAAKIEPPRLVAPRSTADLVEFRRKLFWLADDIRRGRFAKVSRHQYNSPCERCDFARCCVAGDTEGLILSDEAKRMLAA